MIFYKDKCKALSPYLYRGWKGILFFFSFRKGGDCPPNIYMIRFGVRLNLVIFPFYLFDHR